MRARGHRPRHPRRDRHGRDHTTHADTSQPGRAARPGHRDGRAGDRAGLPRRALLARAGWEVRIEAQATMRSTATEFLVDTALDAFEGGKLIASRRFETRGGRY